MESVRRVHKGMFHVDCVFAAFKVHGIVLHGVSVGTSINGLLSSFHVWVAESVERVPVFHIKLVEVWQGDVCPVAGFDDHVWRVTVVFASIIDGCFSYEAFPLSDVHISVSLSKGGASLWSRFIVSTHFDSLKACLVSFLKIIFCNLLFCNDLSPFDCVIVVTYLGKR